MPLDWFEKRGYRHFDLPVNEKFARHKAMDATYVARHSFLPLIHYSKQEKRYKKDPKTKERKIELKSRDIRYASHQDACILSYYAHLLNQRLDAYYETNGISDNVIAYRPLGRGNYDFSAEAFAFAQATAPSTILAFDVSGFFDNLDHGLLKQRLKAILGVTSLPSDWYKIFKTITAFHYVELSALKAHPTFLDRFGRKKFGPIASVVEVKDAGIPFLPNPEFAKGFRRGIPQGTPISAAASNMYMIEFDLAARDYCNKIGALYRRYSDDILVICKPDYADNALAEILRLIASEKLEIAAHKTERTDFEKSGVVPRSSRAAQYLGFSFHEDGPTIRESSLSRQWRKMRRAIRKTRKVAQDRMARGTAQKVFTKKLRRRFSCLKVKDQNGLRVIRNFSSYGRRSAYAFGPGEKITKQVKRFERAAAREMAALKFMSVSVVSKKGDLE